VVVGEIRSAGLPPVCGPKRGGDWIAAPDRCPASERPSHECTLEAARGTTAMTIASDDATQTA
jgi:hypothetical protein